MKKVRIGGLETVEIGGKRLRARIDTGARMSSIDRITAKKLKLGKTVRRTRIKSAHGTSIRPVVKTTVKIKSKKIKASFNLAARSHMKYRVLIGRNILKKGFIIDLTE